MDHLRGRDDDRDRLAPPDLGLVAALNDEWVVWANTEAIYLDLSAWGWVHMIAGALIIVAGLGVFTGNALARAVGVALAAVSLVANFLSIAAYPVWSLVIIALDVFVIWALTAHGRDIIDLR
jgi:hypothetical protein